MRKLPDTSLISYFSNMVKQHGGINLAQGLPGFRPPEALLHHLAETATSDAHQYAPGLGLHALRAQAAEACRCNTIATENIMITNGGTEAISLIYTWLYKKLNHRLRVLSFAPVYESYRELPAIFGNSFSVYRYGDGFSFDLPEFEQQVKDEQINLIFLATPGNPLGRVFSKTELDAICNYCEENHIYLVVDLVYKYLYYNDVPYIPYQRLSQYVLFADSFSKQFSITGWRLGYLIAPEPIIAELASVHDYTGLSSPMPLQRAMSLFLENRAGADSYLDETRAAVAANFARFYGSVCQLGFTPVSAGGGIFLCSLLPETFDDGFEFACDLYEKQQLAVVPGIHFDSTWKPYVRFNIAHPAPILDAALERLTQFIEMSH